MPYNITLLPEDRTVPAEAGENLLRLLQRAGCPISAPCGGNGTCGKCKVLVNGVEVSACKTQINSDMTVSLPRSSAVQVLNDASAVSGGDEKHAYALAFDVGTTTLACCLLDGHTGAVLAKAGMANPQAAYGADVISRIQYVKTSGSRELQESVLAALARLTEDTARQAGIDARQITVATLAGNTAMHHLLLGIDPSPLVRPPYMPAVFEAMEIAAEGVVPIHPEGTVRIFPNIAGFVGGDTVACLVAANFDTLEDLTLLLDVGTNAEMVLGNRHRRIACSAAAGPAFEGAGISRGMSATEGAVHRVDPEGDSLRCLTIGNTAAKGICGSGLLDLIAVLLEQGIISGSGALAEAEFVLPGTNVALTKKDVRQVQLAKSAVCSGIQLLCKTMGVTPGDIRQVYLAGAFGSYLRPESACRIGMIPPVLLNRIRPLGNAAMEGARQCAVREADFRRAQDLAAKTEFLELASMPDFQDCFVDNLLFEEEL